MEELKGRLNNLKERLKVEEKRKLLRELEAAANKPGFWDDWQRAAETMKRLTRLKELLEKTRRLEELVAGQSQRGEAEKLLDELEQETFLSGECDEGGAIMAIHAGAGGIDAQDWAEILERMYLKFFERRGWKAVEVDKSFGEEAGIKRVVFDVDGEFAYGILKYEAGTHRLVRQSPFNAEKLRETSFAAVSVWPDLGEYHKGRDGGGIEIKEEDLEWQFFRSPGPGGQNVNKVATAVRLRHKPSGLMVTVSSQRRQVQNRAQALKLLKGQLWEKEKKRRDEEKKSLRKGGGEATWGTQMRSYILHPYKMVKDHRTGVETRRVDEVFSGNLDEFVEAEVRKLGVVD